MDRIVWIDCEMTGLELGSDALIEVAALVTDSELNVLGEGVDIVISCPADACSTRWCRSSGTCTPPPGSPRRCKASTVTMEQAQEQVLAYIKEWVPEPNKAPLAGNSIATDRNFLARDMPELDAWLHYRMIDVSSIKELAKRWHPKAYYASPEKAGGHRALADIVESIEELSTTATRLRGAPARSACPRAARTSPSAPPRPPPPPRPPGSRCTAEDDTAPGGRHRSGRRQRQPGARRRGRGRRDRRGRARAVARAAPAGGSTPGRSPMLDRFPRPGAGLRQDRLQARGVVGVAQLVEHRVVVPVVAGSSPVTHPT